MYLLPLSIRTLILSLDSEACSLKESLSLSKVVNPVAVEPTSTGVQVNLGKSSFSPLLEKEMATHSSVLAWGIPWTGGPGGLLSLRLHRVGHDWSDACIHSPLQELGNTCQKNSLFLINVQTDLSYTRPQFMPSAQWASPDSSLSSCSQTDLTFGCQVSLPISVQSQTFLPYF